MHHRLCGGAATVVMRPEPVPRRAAQARLHADAAGSVSDVMVNLSGMSNTHSDVRQSSLSVNTSGIQNVPGEIRQSVLSVDKTTSPIVNRSIKFELPSDSE